MLDHFYDNQKLILKNSQDFFQNSSSLIPKIGIELEFFLFGDDGKTPTNTDVVNSFILELQEKLIRKFSLIYEIEKEQGISQIEIKTSFTSDLAILGDELSEAKKFIFNLAKSKNLFTSFAAKPLENECGSALQFNISLHNSENKNLFESDELLLNNTTRNLLENTDSIMILLAPEPEDYARFSLENNLKLFKQGKYTAPVNLSFGADNRTCAIRIPNQKKLGKNGKRMEYRIAAAGANFNLAAAGILLAISLKPLRHLSLQRIYGNAFEEKYQLPKFCSTAMEARNSFFHENNLIKKIMSNLS